MQTVHDLILELAEQIRGMLTDLILNHSSLKRWNYPGSGILSVTGNYSWNPLTTEGHRLQSKVLEEYRHLASLIETLLNGQPSEAQKALEQGREAVLAAITQEDSTWAKTPQEALATALEALQAQVSLLDNLYDGNSGDAVFVPDTNALIYNPNLEDWEFPHAGKVLVVLTPTVLSELDQHKVNHRNEDVRKKAAGLINRIKGYRARGRLTDGVVLRSNKSNLLAMATEPDFNTSLPWLDANNADDRYLASFIEVMRKFPRSAVALVTRDINLQNKAEFARLPFVEPPEPVPHISNP